MKQITPWFLAAVAPVLAIGCTGVPFLGHFAVIGVTLGIFVGTLTLNKVRAQVSEGDASESDATNVDAE